ncbi:MAG: hypothetical protein WCF84_00860 [Anaerolineae bacterium]
MVIPTVAATSTPGITNPTLSQLAQLEIPSNNPVQLAERLKKKLGVVATPAAPIIYKVGDQTNFMVSRDITGTYELISATLRYVTPHADLWVENGENVSDNSLKLAGDNFENHIYPTDRKYLGSEASPGVDNDPHVYILNTHFDPGVAGYYSSADEYPPFMNRYSNQHEMFYMNMLDLKPDSTSYASTLSHEFAHMIHWNENKREGSWITEGFGMLAEQLNGYGQDAAGVIPHFTQEPDLQLDAWGSLPGQSFPHYAASYLFLSYSFNRFGDVFLHDLIDSGTHDIPTVQKALDKDAPGLKFDDVFADWAVANYADDRALGPRYSYLDTPINLRPQHQFSKYPVTAEGTVHQYGTQYVELKPQSGDLTFTFDGATQVKVIPTTAHSGASVWWGNRVDQSDTTLTREFDLTGVKKATLNFWTWYDIESDFDYGYVEVSADGGKTWNPLPGRATTTSDPNGENYGNGLTCKSGSGCDENAPAAQWIQEQMDLSPYAGNKIQVRFEYVTDTIYSGPGFVIDDLSIPEINFSDDVEHGDNGWQAQGFARIDNILAQRFIVQAIEYGPNNQPVKIVPLALDASNHGALTLTGFGRDISRVVIAISGATPITWEQAAYKFTVQ